MRKTDELQHGCVAKARDDEYIFALLGRDPATPDTIRFWIERRIHLGKNTPTDPQIEEALGAANVIEEEHPNLPPAAPTIWTDDEVFRLNAAQHDHTLHGYTCGTDSRHRPLIATRFGWQCADCGYRQGWHHGRPQLPT